MAQRPGEKVRLRILPRGGVEVGEEEGLLGGSLASSEGGTIPAMAREVATLLPLIVNNSRVAI